MPRGHVHHSLFVFTTIPLVLGWNPCGLQAAVREISHTPVVGQYGSINAALADAIAGDVLRIVDNSSPYVESLVIEVDDLTLEGASGLNPAPTISGPEGTNPYDAGLKTGFTWQGQNLFVQRLQLTTDPNNHAVVDGRFGVDARFESVTIDAPATVLNAYRSQQAATLVDCTLRGGLFCVEMYFGGPLIFENCHVGEGASVNAVYLSGGTLVMRESRLSLGDGVSVLRVRSAINGIASDATLEYCLLTLDRDGTAPSALVEFEAGNYPDQSRVVWLDQCDLIGTRTDEVGVKWGAKGELNITDSILQSIGGDVYDGIVRDNVPVGYRLEDDHNVYRKCPQLDVDQIDLVHSRRLLTGEPLYLNTFDEDLRIFANSPVANFNSTGTPAWPGSQGVATTATMETGWVRSETNVIDQYGNMYNPHVWYEPEEAYPFKMLFFGWAVTDCNVGYSGCDAIFLARAQDLDHWEIYAGENAGEPQWDATGDASLWVPVVTASGPYYDQWHNGDPTVVKRDGIYHLVYSSTGFDLDGYPGGDPNDTDGFIDCLMGATSTDLIHWTRSADALLIQASDIGDDSEYGDLDYPTGSFARPSLMYEDGHWRLWFDYWNPGTGVSTAHAENHGDFLNPEDWVITHDLAEPVIPQWPNPDVIKYGDQYFSFCDTVGYPGGVGWTSRQIRVATSPDGLHWTIGDFLAPDSDSPALHVPEAFVHTIDGQDWLYLFYACQRGGDPYNFRYFGIRYMRHRLGNDESSAQWTAY